MDNRFTVRYENDKLRGKCVEKKLRIKCRFLRAKIYLLNAKQVLPNFNIALKVVKTRFSLVKVNN